MADQVGASGVGGLRSLGCRLSGVYCLSDLEISFEGHRVGKVFMAQSSQHFCCGGLGRW